MAVEYRWDISPEITERGIYYADLKVTHKDISIKQDIVFSRYSKEHTFNKFWREHKLSQFGIRENNTAKQVVHMKVTVRVYLSDVSKDTYERWLEKQKKD